MRRRRRLPRGSVTGTVLLESFQQGEFPRSFLFRNPEEIVTATALSEVLPTLARIEEAVAQGKHAAGFVSYDAAPAFDPALAARQSQDFPLLLFAIYGNREEVTAGAGEGGEWSVGAWRDGVDEARHAAAVAAIRELIGAGDAYQVNYTFGSRFRFDGDPFGFYRSLCRAQRAPFCAFIDTGRFCVASASPELFFAVRDGVITTRPMKGTATRGATEAEDLAATRELQESAKERAENLMIVDLLRNDLGRICRPGSVAVPDLFRVETLETLHQMTSTVTGELIPGTRVADIFRALFPCGSVTGAPKKRTMEIIRDLETFPRGLYTGAVGWISPGEAVFSVAIRTAVIDAAGTGEIGIGSGITWDSIPAAEYREALAKRTFVSADIPDFRLIESLLHEEGKGYFLKERHLDRLASSARYFGFRHDPKEIAGRLEEKAAPLWGRSKVRLLLSRDGATEIEAVPLESASPEPVVVTIAARRADSRERFLRHKTTRRPLFRAPEAGSEEIFVNERGELTEGTVSNIVILLGGRLVTPPERSGLLPGVFRHELLERGVIREQVLTPEDLAASGAIFLINSVRKWRRAVLASPVATD